MTHEMRDVKKELSELKEAARFKELRGLKEVAEFKLDKKKRSQDGATIKKDKIPTIKDTLSHFVFKVTDL